MNLLARVACTALVISCTPAADPPPAVVPSAAPKAEAATAATAATVAAPAAQPADAGTTAVNLDEQVPDIEYVPTPQNVADKLLHGAKIQKDDVLYALGCGGGRIVINAAKRFGIKAVGYDIDPVRVAESKE